MHWCSFAWGYELTADPEFLNKADGQAGGDVLTEIESTSSYNLNLENRAALLAMLNSCAPGITVVNIDNGFGAACAASLINHPVSETPS